MTLRQNFNDSRLRYQPSFSAPNPITLTGKELNSIWVPDTFIRNERKVIFHDALAPNAYIRIYPDGRVQTSQRITLDLSCANLRRTISTLSGATCFLDIASCKILKENNFYLDEIRYSLFLKMLGKVRT